MADIKPGSFAGIASLGADRTAVEVLVFPDAVKGSNEGHYPTVATVSGIADAQTLKLDYKGGCTPVVTFQPGKREDAKVDAQKAADGSMTAGRLNVGKGGMIPPM
jgi:hypothetical protein